MSRLWNFSLFHYERPDVAQCCLALQDRLGADVNIVLFLCWLAADCRCVLDDAAIRRVRDAVAPLRGNVIEPLRAGRRRAKSLADGRASGLYERLKAIELEAEHLEQAMLQSLVDGGCPGRHGDSGPETSPAQQARQSLAAYIRVLDVADEAEGRDMAEALVTAVFRPSAEPPDGRCPQDPEGGPRSA